MLFVTDLTAQQPLQNADSSKNPDLLAGLFQPIQQKKSNDSSSNSADCSRFPVDCVQDWLQQEVSYFS